MSASYEAILWLKANSDFDFPLLERKLKRYFPQAAFSQTADSLLLEVGDWKARLHLAEGPHVAIEAREIPLIFPSVPHADEIASFHRRVELLCSQDDPDMEHFNDFVFICQVLEEFQGGILFDPSSGQLI